jgi:hypothetical protein
MSLEYNTQLSIELRRLIEENIINPDIINETAELISSRYKWRKVSNITEVLANIFLGTTTILAFTSGIYEYKILSFFTGCTSTIALVLLRFSTYANKESTERNTLLTKLLNYIGISALPDPVIATQETLTTPNNSIRTSPIRIY